jgi:hypothetical protein
MLPPNDFAERRESWLSQQTSNSNTKTNSKSKGFLRRENLPVPDASLYPAAWRDHAGVCPRSYLTPPLLL